MKKNTAIISLFATCTMKCGYCDLAESGQVLDNRQLLPFKNKDYVLNIASFFNSRTTDSNKWQLLFTGGEPLIAPNMDVLCNALFKAGNSVAFYTSLHVGEGSASWKLLMSSSFPQVEYIMASLHPEAEAWEEDFFRKITALKARGHKIFLRYVGHPKRLHRLKELEARCKDLDICFFPTTLLSSVYPKAYTDNEREQLSQTFSSLTQFIQLEGGIDTTNVDCHAGSKIIAVDIQSGNITPCITLANPILGNIHTNDFKGYTQSIKCPKSGINCVCDIHFQQDIIIGAEDNLLFEAQKDGFIPAISEIEPLSDVKNKGINFYKIPETGMGVNTSPDVLIFSKEYVKKNFQKNILRKDESLIEKSTMEPSDLLGNNKSWAPKFKSILSKIFRTNGL